MHFYDNYDLVTVFVAQLHYLKLIVSYLNVLKMSYISKYKC